MKLEVNADWLTNEIYITAWYEHNDLRTKPTECTIHRTCIDELIAELQKDFKVLYNDGLKLITVRHYYPSTLDALTKDKTILLEQRSRHTAQIVLKQ